MTVHPQPHPLPRLLHRQCGVATLEQLTATGGLTAHQVAAQVAARRWQRIGAHCVLSHNLEPTRTQWLWVAVLDHPGPVALGGLTALQLHGFTFFGRELERVHIVVPRGTRCHELPGVQVHESSRFGSADVEHTHDLPHTRLARSAIDAGAWQPFARYACGLLAGVVQQRLCATNELAQALATAGRVRHEAQMRLVLHDIAGGGEALSELDIGRLCRRHLGVDGDCRRGA
jgi:hypothetical protein